MYKFLISLLMVCSCAAAHAQLAYPYRDIKLEKPSDYKETETLALSAANFLLGTPFNEFDSDRNGALQFLNNWITGTKEHQFYLKGLILEVSVDKNLLSLFIAAMVKYSLENKKEAVNPIKVDQQTAKIVLAYCTDAKNNITLKKKLRKLLEDHQPVNN